MAPYQIVLVRHGESAWNKDNRFCGWIDVDLSENGVQESLRGGVALREAGYKFDLAFTSLLKRAQRTLDIILKEIGQEDLPVLKSWRLNERHYGALTGLNKVETAAKHGKDQVQVWRRSYDIPPPAMDADHPYYKQIVEDERYKNQLCREDFPMAETLKSTLERTLPFWNDEVCPEIRAGKRILVVAHGTSLRGIVKHVENLTDEAIIKLNLPNGIPFIYQLDENLKTTGPAKFLADDETVRKEMAKVGSLGKSK